MFTFNNYLKSYMTACIVTAVIYAFATGAYLPLSVCLTDSLIYCCIIITAGWLLGNIFRFALPVNCSRKYRSIFLPFLAISTCLLIAGIEAGTMFLLFPSSFERFVPTLPARIFIAFLLYIIFYLYFYSIEGKSAITENNSEIMPVKSSHSDDFEQNNSSNGPTSLIYDRITVRSGNKIKIIPIENIIYIKADGDYISIHTAEGRWLKEQTMSFTEVRLPTQSFVRIHRSYIVNIHQISRIERYGEKQLIVLHNNEKIKISAARYQLLRQILGI